MTVELFANQPSTTVSSGGTDAPSSGTQEMWTVASSSAFPAASSGASPPSQFHVADAAQAAASELIAVTNISGDTWTVTRGAESTTPVEHDAGFTIYQVVSAGVLGTFAQAASAGTAGQTLITATTGTLKFANAPVAWQNAVTVEGADPTGSDDSTTAIQDTISKGGVTYLPPGTYLISAPLTVSSALGQVITGDGPETTYLTITSEFSGAAAIIINGGADCVVQNLGIQGVSSTYSDNPAADGIQVNHSQNPTVRGVLCSYVNGYALEIASDATGDSGYPRVTDVHPYYCKAGIHLVGTESSDHLMGAFLLDIMLDNCQDGDGILIEDVVDTQIVNVDSAGNLGSVVHIQGGGDHFLNNIDLSTSSTMVPALLIEASGIGDPSQVSVTNSLVQSGSTACTVAAGSQITFTGCVFAKGNTTGLSFTGDSDNLIVAACQFNGNGAGGGTGNYDLSMASSGNIAVLGCVFTTPGGSSAGQVTNAVDCPDGTSNFTANLYLGASAYNNDPTFRLGNNGDGSSTIRGSLNTGLGISGQTISANGLTGATAASRYVGATASGAPASGTFATGDFCVDQTAGSIHVCTAGGSPGTWT